jgi:hypothetical protein
VSGLIGASPGSRFQLSVADNPGSPFKELIPPALYDIRVDIKLRGQLGQRLLVLNSGKRHLRLEGRAVVLARSSRHGISCSRHHAAVRQKSHLSQLSSFPEPALTTSVSLSLFLRFKFQIMRF